MHTYRGETTLQGAL